MYIHICVKFSTRLKSAEEWLVIFIPNCTGKALDSRMAIAKLWRKNTHSTTKLTLLTRVRKQMHYVYKSAHITILAECEWTMDTSDRGKLSVTGKQNAI